LSAFNDGLTSRVLDGNERNSKRLDGINVFLVQGSLEILNAVLGLASEEAALRLGDDHERLSNLEVGSPEDLFPLNNIGDGGVLSEDNLQVVEFTLGIRELEVLDVTLVGFNELLEFSFLHEFDKLGSSTTFHGERVKPNLEQIGKSSLLDGTGSIISVRVEVSETLLGLQITEFGGGVTLEHLEDGAKTTDSTE